MSVHKLLERLDKVRQERRGQWVACCPAHVDKSPSLAIGEADDGRVLVHCHSGCSALDVITSIGLQWSDLYPETDRNHRSLMSHIRTRPKHLELEDRVISLAEDAVKSGKKLSSSDKSRLKQAIARGGVSDNFPGEVRWNIALGMVEQQLTEAERILKND